MKIAELFADLGFKVQGAEELKQFETTLTNIAQAARNAALALRLLARTPVPRNLGKAMAAAQAVQPGAKPQPAPGAAPNQAPAAPTNPLAPGQPKPPQSVVQGLRQLGMLGLKVAGFAALAVAIKKLISSVVELTQKSAKAAFEVDKFTNQTGISRQELKQWERVAALSDLKTEELHETLKQLQQRAIAIRQGDAGMNAYYGLLGIDPRDKPTDLLKNFARRTRGMDPAQATYYASQVGISEGMAYMLRKNVDRLDELLGTEALSGEEHSAVMELNKAWKEMTFSMTVLRDKLVADVAPAFTTVVDIFSRLAGALSGDKGFRDSVYKAGMLTPFLGPLPAAAAALSRPAQSAPITVNQYIDGSKDPKATAREAVKELGRTFGDAYYMRPQPTP